MWPKVDDDSDMLIEMDFDRCLTYLGVPTPSSYSGSLSLRYAAPVTPHIGFFTLLHSPLGVLSILKFLGNHQQLKKSVSHIFLKNGGGGSFQIRSENKFKILLPKNYVKPPSDTMCSCQFTFLTVLHTSYPI